MSSSLPTYQWRNKDLNEDVTSSDITIGNEFCLSSGPYILLSNHAATDFASITQLELAQYRNLGYRKLDENLHVYRIEFAIPSICYAVEELH